MYIITGILLLALTAMLTTMHLSENTVSIGIMVIYILSGFVGGLLAGKRMKNRKYLWGIVMGACYFSVLVLGSVVLHRRFEMDITRFTTALILCIASDMVGGMLS